MSTLEKRLHDDLTESIRARDEIRSATLRMALTAVKNEAVSGTEARELSDAEVVTVLGREAKKRREAATAYDAAARPELAALVAAAIAETGADSPKAMGQVMKVLTPRVAGRADGGRVAAAVKAALAG